MVHAGGVFVASIHPSWTWMSGSFESMWWNACEHRLDLGLYSHMKEFWKNRVRTPANSKGKNPLCQGLRGGSNSQHRSMQDSELNTILSHSVPPPPPPTNPPTSSDVTIVVLLLNKEPSIMWQIYLRAEHELSCRVLVPVLKGLKPESFFSTHFVVRVIFLSYLSCSLADR